MTEELSACMKDFHDINQLNKFKDTIRRLYNKGYRMHQAEKQMDEFF